MVRIDWAYRVPTKEMEQHDRNHEDRRMVTLQGIWEKASWGAAGKCEPAAG